MDWLKGYLWLRKPCPDSISVPVHHNVSVSWAQRRYRKENFHLHLNSKANMRSTGLTSNVLWSSLFKLIEHIRAYFTFLGIPYFREQLAVVLVLNLRAYITQLFFCEKSYMILTQVMNLFSFWHSYWAVDPQWVTRFLNFRKSLHDYFK